MSDTNNTKNSKNDEIDLLDLFKRMVRSISRMSSAIGRATLVSIVFLLRRWIWLTLSVLIGIGISWVIKVKSDKIYSSELTIRSNAVPSSDMITYINRLHSFCRQADRTALATAFSLSPEETRVIKDIQAFWAIDLLNDGIPDRIDYKGNYDLINDTVSKRMLDRFVVRVRTKTLQEFPLLKEKILEYISQNTLFQQKNQVRLALNKEIQVRLIYDIDQLDSLQKVKYFEETRNRIRSSGGQMIFLQEQNTQLIYTDIYSLYSRKQAIDSEMELYKDVVTVLDDFTQPANPINGTLYYGKIIIPLFFLITLLILVLLANREKLKEIYHKY